MFLHGYSGEGDEFGECFGGLVQYNGILLKVPLKLRYRYHHLEQCNKLEQHSKVVEALGQLHQRHHKATTLLHIDP